MKVLLKQFVMCFESTSESPHVMQTVSSSQRTVAVPSFVSKSISRTMSSLEM